MTTPICRCRVLYLGSAVPHITKDGLQGIQEPLRDLYPGQGPLTAKGIDSWLSVWSNGLLLENVDESNRPITRFFAIESLHYCAAVRNVVLPDKGGEKVEKFLPLDSPFVRHANPNHPPLFACILRRITGIKVLECHGFICKKDAAANALVRCCFHAYADNVQARQLEENPYYLETRRSRSISGLDAVQKVEDWRHDALGDDHVYGPESKQGTISRAAAANGENYKVWLGAAPTEQEVMYFDSTGSIRSARSLGVGSTRSLQPRKMPFPPLPPLPPHNLAPISGKESKSKAKAEKLLKLKKKGKGQEVGTVITNGMPHGPPLMTVPSKTLYAGSGLYTERRGKKGERIPILPIEEPVYMPSARPITPTASYQPGVFPHESYLFQNYGTSSRPPKGTHRKKSEEKGKISSEPESPFNTGIYRKKGHINERAFSFSIRQEHRSRSISLANLHFFSSSSGDGNEPNGESSGSFQNRDKKELELVQLVKDLNLKENGHENMNGQSNFIRKKTPNYLR
ncbi:uncharacterized protein LOC106469771 [Limulus polyphemus]|uniref:Uncharacterized protein LOC106469771 n=1 Tax=Limulus polyphemus TaxID=6850 RepID=A0ABM1BNT4_LIMPO|nr:uncharacterized protein LOC106469771 [Limulus polyphemus]